jgi:hypothetical protein
MRRQFERPRGEHRHLVAACELACERRHDDAAATAERRILIVAE